ncbi:MAG: polysaccharide pyruvyl transferase family protein [Candidatus Bathyarchaeia archaeon]
MSKLPSRIHIVHVGTMNNMGTQALLESDVSALREIAGNDVLLSVSTTDEAGVKKLSLGLDAVVPNLVDIPFRKADDLAIRLKISRSSSKYKALTFLLTIYMLFQVELSILSAILVKMRLKPLYRSKVFDRICNCNLVISCSDENFREVPSLISSQIYWVFVWWSILFERTFEISVARYFKKPTVMFPNSVGPFKTFVGRFLSRLSLNNCNRILIRDSISYELVKSLDIKAPRILTSDSVLLFSPDFPSKLKNNEKSNNRPVIGVSAGIYNHTVTTTEIRKYIKEHALALDIAIEELGAEVIFLPHYITGFRYDDLEISNLILQSMKHKNGVRIIQVDNAREFKSILGQMSIIVSSKMHPAVIGISMFTPTLCIAYDHKQMGFFEDIGMSQFLVRFDEISHEVIFSKINSLWEERGKLHEELEIKVTALQESLRISLRKAICIYIQE